MWYTSGPKLAQRAARNAVHGGIRKEENAPSTDAYARAGDEDRPKDVQDFLKTLRMKFGSVTRGWRVALDRDGSGYLEFREFIEAMRDMGCGENGRSLWFNLDIAQSGRISLYQLDELAAHALDRFRFACTSKFGSIQAAFDELFDEASSGVVFQDDFVAKSSRLGYGAKEAEELFHFLHLRPGATTLTMQDLKFLQNWEWTKKEEKEKKGNLHIGWVNRDPFAAVEYRNIAQKLANKEEASRPTSATSSSPSHARRSRPSSGSTHTAGLTAAELFKTQAATWEHLQLEPPAATKAALAASEAASRPPTAGGSAASRPGNVTRPSSATTAAPSARVASATKPAAASKSHVRREEHPATLAACKASGEAVGSYAFRHAAEEETSFGRFIDFLLERFHTLADAWDTMDPQGTGEIRESEFESVVCFKLRYCRNSDARRLYHAIPKQEAHRITWRDLGLSSQEWIEFLTQKKWQEQLRQNELNQAGKVGRGAREALENHYRRTQKQVPKLKMAFGEKMPPPTWGAPLPKWSRPHSAASTASTASRSARAPRSAREGGGHGSRPASVRAGHARPSSRG
eukprot:gb/GFBE01035469.1/.p1 GENE.gb/GFBE01035469.1/~~gb/GFBE01035469.1/.p1  ORF type:complete len:574 (+),score=102.45 gb/GFBE01035469.1/:1-1722(+)